MHNNGVSHDVAPNDLEGIHTMLRWLSYVPKVIDLAFFCLVFFFYEFYVLEEEVQQ